jgi:hypothetical protein
MTEAAAGKIRNCRGIARPPRTLERAIFALDAQVGPHSQATTVIEREVGLAEGRVGHNTGRPDDQIRAKRFARGELNLSVRSRPKLRAEVHGSSALREVLENPLAGLERNFRHDAVHGLDEVKVSIVKRYLGVVLEDGAGQRA